MQRGSTARRDLAARHPAFDQVSPRLGTIDEGAFADLLDDDPDEALTLLVDASRATDRQLAAVARSLAARLALDLVARNGSSSRGPAARLRTVAMPETGGDLDLDGSLDAIGAARRTGRPPAVHDLRARAWARPARALSLLIDRSGSMRGPALAAAALAAAAVALRAPEDHSVLAFGEDVIVVKAQDQPRPAEEVLADLLGLRGHGPTDLALALRAAGAQLDRSPAGERMVVVLSDGRSTEGADPTSAARELAARATLALVAPEADADAARALAEATGARLATVAGPADIVAAFAALLP